MGKREVEVSVKPVGALLGAASFSASVIALLAVLALAAGVAWELLPAAFELGREVIR